MIHLRRALGASALFAIVTIVSAAAEPVLPSALPGSLGEDGWAGNAGTLFWIDPKQQLIAIYMVQVNDGDRIMLRN